ncbi:hypothetical protein BDV12DRAFT_210665 [Aspergillus spectabilis]
MPPPLDAKKFYIFGRNISFSISPTIHNAGFAHDNLPHTYTIHELSAVDSILPLMKDPLFGGASVTMPHKLHVSKFCTEISETARAIGAINTLVVYERESDTGRRKRVISGDNTDWSGLYAIIKKYIEEKRERQGETTKVKTGLVIGAGGASRAALYALYRAGIQQIYLVNRTLSTAEKVRDDYRTLFDIAVLRSLPSLPSLPEIIIGTVPAETTTETQFESLFQGQGLCIDMSYKPPQTPLLAVAQRCKGWTTVTGVEVLLAQAFDQYGLWTGLEPPKREMIEAVEAREGRGLVRGML